jgi:hypothetical protein
MPHQPTGNPVFDYKAGFRAFAQSLQRVLCFSGGMLLIVAGLIGRFIKFADAGWNLTLRWAPVLGLALIVISTVWGYAWRSKLRSDFQREYGPK